MRTTIAERAPIRAGIEPAHDDQGHEHDNPRRRRDHHNNGEDDDRHGDAALVPAKSSDRQRPPGTRVRL